jgi:tetratricopeptide (TPR) repeat protein
MIKKASLALVVLTLGFAPVWAQTQGKIEGRVVGSSGQPVEKAAVSIISTRTASVHYELVSDKNGKFLQIGLTPGNYLVNVKKDGFASYSSEARVKIDETTSLDITLKTVEAAVQKTLSEADSLFLKGNKLYAEQNYAEASAAYDKAVAIDPANWRYRLNQGLSLKKQGQAEAAMAAFLKAVELYPEVSSANKEAGESLAKAEKFAEARPFFEKAAALDPDNADVHYNLGLCLSSLGEPEAALAQFQRVIELQPDYADAHYQIGTLLIGQNRIPEAVASLEKFLALAPQHEKAGLARQLLQALKK